MRGKTFATFTSKESEKGPNKSYGPKIKINGSLQHKPYRGHFWVITVEFFNIKEKTKINCAEYGLYFKTKDFANESMKEVAHQIAMEMQAKLRNVGNACEILDKTFIN